MFILTGILMLESLRGLEADAATWETLIYAAVVSSLPQASLLSRRKWKAFQCPADRRWFPLGIGQLPHHNTGISPVSESSCLKTSRISNSILSSTQKLE